MTNLAPEEAAAEIASSAAEAFLEGEISRSEFLARLGHVCHMNGDTVTKTGPLRSEGRISFGRSREGQDGVAIWFPEEVLPDRPPAPPGSPQSTDE